MSKIVAPDKFKIIYIDFPWQYNQRNNSDTKFGTGMHKYSGMSLNEILDISSLINDIADKDCALLGWATGAKSDEFFKWAFHMEQYGFRYCSKIYTWLKVSKEGKPRALPGFYSLSNVEDVYLLARGKVKVEKKGEKQVFLEELSTEVLEGVCLKPHSKKPLIIRDRIKATFGDVPRIEIFSRSDKKLDSSGWWNVGNEVNETLGLDIRDALDLIKVGNYLQ